MEGWKWIQMTRLHEKKRRRYHTFSSSPLSLEPQGWGATVPGYPQASGHRVPLSGNCVAFNLHVCWHQDRREHKNVARDVSFQLEHFLKITPGRLCAHCWSPDLFWRNCIVTVQQIWCMVCSPPQHVRIVFFPVVQHAGSRAVFISHKNLRTEQYLVSPHIIQTL